MSDLESTSLLRHLSHPNICSDIRNCIIPFTAKVIGWSNLYDSELGEDVVVGPFCEIGGAKIGDRTRISSHSYICPGVTIGTDCFIAHQVAFTNDTLTVPLVYEHMDDLRISWKSIPTLVGNYIRIGTGAIILPGVQLGDHCIIGAGAVVTRNVAPYEIVAGVPAKVIDQAANPWEAFS